TAGQPKKLLGERGQSGPVAPGQPARVDFEYVRQGVCVVWMFVEALAGWRDVAVTATKAAVDWARQVQALVDHPRYACAERITLVGGNLHTAPAAARDQAVDAARGLPPG